MNNRIFVNVPLTASGKQQIETLAKKRDCTMSELFRVAISEMFGISVNDVGPVGRPKKEGKC